VRTQAEHDDGLRAQHGQSATQFGLVLAGQLFETALRWSVVDADRRARQGVHRLARHGLGSAVCAWDEGTGPAIVRMSLGALALLDTLAEQRAWLEFTDFHEGSTDALIVPACGALVAMLLQPPADQPRHLVLETRKQSSRDIHVATSADRVSCESTIDEPGTDPLDERTRRSLVELGWAAPLSSRVRPQTWTYAPVHPVDVVAVADLLVHTLSVLHGGGELAGLHSVGS
jgi:hypothetical protein